MTRLNALDVAAQNRQIAHQFNRTWLNFLDNNGLLMQGVEHCRFNDELYAIIVRATFREPGITFFSSPELSQQLAYMKHPAGKSIAPHRHNRVTREVHFTQEVLVIQKGKLQVDFYTEAEKYLESRVLGAGDVILLCGGAHGFEVLEPLEMIEIKQGPYAGENDKTRFLEAPASVRQIKGAGS